MTLSEFISLGEKEVLEKIKNSKVWEGVDGMTSIELTYELMKELGLTKVGYIKESKIFTKAAKGKVWKRGIIYVEKLTHQIYIFLANGEYLTVILRTSDGDYYTNSVCYDTL